MENVSSSFHQLFNNGVMKPEKVREICRNNEYQEPTLGVCKEYLQCNLIVVPKAQAFEFMLFCHRNPKSCPLLEVTDPGQYTSQIAAQGADLRTDLPKYKLFDLGEPVAEVMTIEDIWYDDFVCFLVASTMTFENTLRSKNIPVRHIEEGSNIPLFKTDKKVEGTPLFGGFQYVSMCPMKPDQAIEAIRMAEHYQYSNGTPFHIGDPSQIGIEDLSQPDYGDPVSVAKDEIPVFWCHDYTAHKAIMRSRIQTAVMSLPGYMLVTDIKIDT